jgi:hypothetical protein
LLVPVNKFALVAMLVALSGTALAADFAPSLQWVKTAGGSGANSVIAAAADASGNLYIAGNTSSIDFPVVSAAQPNAGGSPLVRINTGSRNTQTLYPPGLSAISSISGDPENANALYGTSANAIWHSADAGSTWAVLYTFASSVRVNSVAVDPSNQQHFVCGHQHPRHLQEHRWRPDLGGDQQRHSSSERRRDFCVSCLD